MSVRRIRTRLAALAFICACPVAGGSIEGRVTNSVTGESIVGAKVRYLDRHSYVYSTVTDTSGAYQLSGLDDGEYHAEFSKDGFSNYRQGSSLLDDSTVRVSGNSPARMDGQLQPWGSLRGRVSSEDGKPATGVMVELMPRARESMTMTDANGEFAFEQLMPGSYKVVAKPESHTQIREGEKVGSVPVYYPSATKQVDAAAISVNWGQNVAGIEIRLKSVPVHRIAGVVLDAGGDPAGHATVTLMGRTSATRQLLFFGPVMVPGEPIHYIGAPGRELDLTIVQTREDGVFEFPAVEPGEWRLRADIDPDEKPRSGVATAILTDKDIDNVQIRMSTPFRVEVTADWGNVQAPKARDGSPVVAASMVQVVAEEGQPRIFDSRGDMTSVNGALPGRYRVLPFTLGLDGFYPGAVMFGGRDVLGQTIELAPSMGPLQVTVRHDSGTVRGTVDNGSGATAFLIPKSPGEMIDYESVPCGVGGTFEFRNIVPGDYYVVAFDHGGQMPLADLPDSIANMATEVRVEPSAAGLPLSIRLNKWRW